MDGRKGQGNQNKTTWMEGSGQSKQTKPQMRDCTGNLLTRGQKFISVYILVYYTSEYYLHVKLLA